LQPEIANDVGTNTKHPPSLRYGVAGQVGQDTSENL